MTQTEISRVLQRDIMIVNRRLAAIRATVDNALKLGGKARNPDPKSIRILCNGKEAELVASNTQTVARCVSKRGGGFIVTTREGGSGWSLMRVSEGAHVVILPGGEVRLAPA